MSKRGGVERRVERRTDHDDPAQAWQRRAGARPFVVGHRGGRGKGWPAENTLPAFERALDEGADGLELDVRLARGGEPIVFHDEDLARMTGGVDVRRVGDVPWVELARATLEGGGRVPLLEDVLAWAKHTVRVNVEIKRVGWRGRPGAWLVGTLKLARAVGRVVLRTRAEVILSSFDPSVLAALRALAPRVPRALLTEPNQSPVSAHRLDRVGTHVLTRLGIDAVNLERSEATPGRLMRLRQAGLRVGVWTVNDATEAGHLASLGADWIITDVPAAVREGFARRAAPN
jgi:glycerophosphoryl diester phosphodiesterase